MKKWVAELLTASQVNYIATFASRLSTAGNPGMGEVGLAAFTHRTSLPAWGGAQFGSCHFGKYIFLSLIHSLAPEQELRKLRVGYLNTVHVNLRSL